MEELKSAPASAVGEQLHKVSDMGCPIVWIGRSRYGEVEQVVVGRRQKCLEVVESDDRVLLPGNGTETHLQI